MFAIFWSGSRIEICARSRCLGLTADVVPVIPPVS
jgi:hypothetical protein